VSWFVDGALTLTVTGTTAFSFAGVPPGSAGSSTVTSSSSAQLACGLVEPPWVPPAPSVPVAALL